MILNGFEIDKFNQYNLVKDAKDSICPLCSHTRKKNTEKCASLDWNTGLGTCHHCGEVFQLHTYKRKREVKEYVKPKAINNTDLSDKVVEWFRNRKISQVTLINNNISEGKEYIPQVRRERNTIQFNYFEHGELVNIKYRDGEKNFKLFKGGKLIFYNIDNIRTAKECIIVEGELDALSYWEAGLQNVVSTPNGSTLKGVNLEYLDNTIEYFENKDKIYLALDNDEAGKNVTKELVRRLGADKCFLVDFGDCKDANEYLVKHGREALKNTIVDAKEIPIEGVSSVLDWEKEYDHYLVNGMQKGFTSGLKAFDDNFSTYTGQCIAVTGLPSSGKSDFVDELCIRYSLRYGWKTAFASPENKPNFIHAGKIESKLVGTWVNSELKINTNWHKQAKEYIDDYFKFIDIDDYSLENVLEISQQMVRKYGIKVLVIDPYNKIRLKRSLNKSITEYTNDYLIELDNFARKNDILIILVAHPRKPDPHKALEYEPTFYDIKGGGEFYDMLPHGLLVHRDYSRDLVFVKTLKVKFVHLGSNNKVAWFKWDMNSGRFLEFQNVTERPDELGNLLIDNSNWLTKGENEAQQLDLSNYVDNTFFNNNNTQTPF